MNDNVLRLQQQVIHYKSEVEKYKNKLEEMELFLEREKIRNRYLQSKLMDMKKEVKNSFIHQLKVLTNKILELEVQLEEEKALNQDVVPTDTHHIVDTSPIKTLSYFAYFNHSILFPMEGEAEITVISDLNLVNNGDLDLEDLLVCIRVKPLKQVNLSAKIANPKLIQDSEKLKPAAEWIYAIEDWRNKILNDGEYWIRPSQHSNLLRQTTMSLKGIELIINKNDFKGRVIVEAFIYGSNVKDNTAALNKIIVQM
ncbi:hypothetical protein [Sutcliffiella horikoshii]|uniref:hypothetical protein n=1 Tax=Sutcliffiella horikoshii TaxID=79883 RepID=UPI001CFE8DD3|nr:hypothetical protein [Sutcliffiella horikoshii]